MKKFVAFLISAVFTLGASGCSSNDAPPQSNGSSAQQEKKDSNSETDDGVLNVGVIQLVDNGAFEDMREGFISRLRELGYTEDKLKIDYKNAQGDATNLNSICREMVDSKVDLIAAIATPSAQAIVNMESDIPVVFISVSNPVGAGIITDMENPDKNATGTSNAIPGDEIFKL